MKKVIFTQEWMTMHPYEKPDEVDLYYTELANEIYHALDEACFTHNFKNVEDAKQLALSIAGYFEDILSGTEIWKTFTAECMKRYGCHIPFYEKEAQYINSSLAGNDETYDADEINFADIKFLLWHHYQQSSYVQEAVPFLFGTLELAAKMVYDILNKEYETAPENERLHDFLCELPTDKDKFFEYRDVLAWFHYSCYFNLNNRKRLQLELEQLAHSQQGINELLAYSTQMEHTMNYRCNLLALTSAEWLAKISEHHPAHKLWTSIDYKSARAFLVKKEDEKYIYVKDLYEEETDDKEEDLLKVRKDSTNIEDFTPFLSGEHIIVTNLFEFGGDWWQTGALLSPLYKGSEEEIASERARLSHEQGIKDFNLLKEKGYGDKFVFLEDNNALKKFLDEIGYQLPSNVKLPQKFEKGIIVCGTPYTGINITYGQAHNIASSENPYYNQERAEQESFGIICGTGRPFPYEIVCKLIESNMLPDANLFTSKYVKEAGLRITQEHLQFLVDYYLMGRKDKDLSPKELWK